MSRHYAAAYQRPHQADAERPKLKRTAAEVDVLKKRHETRKAVFVKAMVRERLLTEAEASRQYDDQFRRW